MEVRRDGFVEDLKASILQKMPQKWDVKTTELRAFLANIPDTDQGMWEFQRNTRKYEVLGNSKKIASLFENDPSEDTIHIAIQ